MHQGYIKLWRQSLDKGWLANPKLWTFWCYCLLKATHKEMDQIVGYQTVHLMPGDFIFGLNKASKELKMSIQSIRTSLHFLKIEQNLTIKITNKFSIISIVNWHTYQDNEYLPNSQSNKPVTNQQQASNKPVTTNNNIKNIKNVKNVEESNIICRVVEYLNLKTSRKFRVTDKVKKLVQARLNETFTEDDFYTVIDNMALRWLQDQKMSRFLRPETLFSNKFDGYLNESPRPYRPKMTKEQEELTGSLETLKNWKPREVREKEDGLLNIQITNGSDGFDFPTE